MSSHTESYRVKRVNFLLAHRAVGGLRDEDVPSLQLQARLDDLEIYLASTRSPLQPGPTCPARRPPRAGLQ